MNERSRLSKRLRRSFDIASFDLEISLKVTHQPLVAAEQCMAEQSECIDQLLRHDVLDQSTDSAMIRLLQLRAYTRHIMIFTIIFIYTTCLHMAMLFQLTETETDNTDAEIEMYNKKAQLTKGLRATAVRV